MRKLVREKKLHQDPSAKASGLAQCRVLEEPETRREGEETGEIQKKYMVRWRRGTHGGQRKQEQAQEDKQESCGHIGTSLTPAIQGTKVSLTLSGEQMPVRSTSVACQCAPRPLYTKDRCWLACPRVSAGRARVRRAELPGDPSAESNLPPVVDGDHSSSKGLCCLCSSPHLAPCSHGTFGSSTRLTSELPCCEHVRWEHAINAGQPTNRLSYYYSRH